VTSDLLNPSSGCKAGVETTASKAAETGKNQITSKER
jgi:hypothetical protein